MHVKQHHFEILDSTQNRARELIASQSELPLLVTAGTQTAGRGRMGREWQSAPGNFYGSIALRAPVDPARYHEYSLLAGVTLQQAISQFTNGAVTLKWPNDVLLDGRKCAGILIESEGMQNEFLIIGMGVNLIHSPEYAAAVFATESAGEGGERFTSALLAAFQAWHQHYLSAGFAVVRAAWLEHAHALGQQITVKTPVAEMHGIFAGIDADGSLLLTRDGQRTKVTAADVRII